jgi:translation initiation factor 2 alpha subunit (eIF-2alpha)
MTPEDVVQPGSLVWCKVIKVDREKSQISLSLKVRNCIFALVQSYDVSLKNKSQALQLTHCSSS